MIFSGLNEKLRGQPDQWVTAALIVVAIVAIAVALKAPPAVKVAALAWMLAP